MSYISMIKKIKERIGFRYLLVEIQLYQITHNIFKIKDNESIMCGFHCIAFAEYMLAGKTLLNYTNLFFLNDHIKNEKIICKFFKDKYDGISKSSL